MLVPVSFAVIGPGRVGTALARRWHEAGLRCVGFFGRDPARVRAAVEFAGAGEAIEDPAGLQGADAVAVTVSDGALAEVVASLAARHAVGARALWLHTSGVHGLAPLAPVVARGGRPGALHPACPFPDAASGYAALPGRSALVEGTTDARALLEKLARAAGLHPIYTEHVDRGLYHAACALSANGTTALLGLCAALLEHAAGLPADSASALAGDLGGAAARLTAERGAVAALTGPVRRGDAEVIARHRQALHDVARADPTCADAEDLYRALMALALGFARRAGLSARAAARIVRTLAEDRGG